MTTEQNHFHDDVLQAVLFVPRVYKDWPYWMLEYTLKAVAEVR